MIKPQNKKIKRKPLDFDEFCGFLLYFCPFYINYLYEKQNFKNNFNHPFHNFGGGTRFSFCEFGEPLV